MTALMCAIAWDVSGGHFNPAITLGVYVAEKDFKGNAPMMATMIVAQILGAFFGVLLGFMALFTQGGIDIVNFSGEYEVKVAPIWVSIVAPAKANG